MTAFALTEEQRVFAGQVRSMAAEQLRPIAEAGPPGHVNRELIKAMGELGLLARLFPGIGSLSREAAATDLCLLREALATQSTEAETALALQGLGSYPVLQSGQEEIVQRWMPAVAAGDAVAAFALTEPGAGSDLAGLQTRAVQMKGDGEVGGGDWILDGQKVWTSVAQHSQIGMALCRTDPDAPKHKGITAFIVNMKAPGVDVRPLRQMTGGADFNEVFLTDVRVRDDYRLGGVDEGWRVALTTLMNERATVGGDRRGTGRALTAPQHVGAHHEVPGRVEGATRPDERIPPSGLRMTGPGRAGGHVLVTMATGVSGRRGERVVAELGQDVAGLPEDLAGPGPARRACRCTGP